MNTLCCDVHTNIIQFVGYDNIMDCCLSAKFMSVAYNRYIHHLHNVLSRKTDIKDALLFIIFVISKYRPIGYIKKSNDIEIFYSYNVYKKILGNSIIKDNKIFINYLSKYNYFLDNECHSKIIPVTYKDLHIVLTNKRGIHILFEDSLKLYSSFTSLSPFVVALSIHRLFEQYKIDDRYKVYQKYDIYYISSIVDKTVILKFRIEYPYVIEYDSNKIIIRCNKKINPVYKHSWIILGRNVASNIINYLLSGSHFKFVLE